MISGEPGPPLDAELQSLRSQISDLGYQIDSYKTKKAAAFGLGVFLLLLAIGAVYDLVTGNSGVWMMLGISRDSLNWIAGGLGVVSLMLLGIGASMILRTDKNLATKLDEAEREYAELLESKERQRQ
ncbi:MAG TPA: hypothetical protein VN743_07665 [Blastocatellia bacterium]|nr:hypothetical protein [Blastocatellia bacterium]